MKEVEKIRWRDAIQPLSSHAFLLGGAMTFRLAAVWLGIFAANAAYAGGDVERGKELYQSLCSSCHSMPYSGTGPAHLGLFGRKAGGRDDYSYSPALKASAIVWNEATLDAWLADPEKTVPGQKMGAGVPAAQDRADLIAFLKIATVER